MSEQFIKRFKEWDSFYGKLITFAFRLFLTVSLLAGKLYIDNHYVDKPHFDKYAQEQKADLKEINGKLDTLLQAAAANTQRFTDTERRISRLEDRTEKER